MKEIKTSVYLKRLFRRAKQVKGNENLTLKNFVRKLAEEGDSYAAGWFSHKSLQCNAEAKKARLANKGARIALEKAATKMARHKKSERSRKTTTTTTTETTKSK
jgi:hypothetical protein